MSTNKPHIHAALIKAWADGAKIQWFDDIDSEWKCIDEPRWAVRKQYRIKPEPVYTEYYKRAVFKLNSNSQEFIVSAVPELFIKCFEQDVLFVRWVDTEPQRELVSE